MPPLPFPVVTPTAILSLSARLLGPNLTHPVVRSRGERLFSLVAVGAPKVRSADASSFVQQLSAWPTPRRSVSCLHWHCLSRPLCFLAVCCYAQLFGEVRSNNSNVESWSSRANPEMPFPSSPISVYPPAAPNTQHTDTDTDTKGAACTQPSPSTSFHQSSYPTPPLIPPTRPSTSPPPSRPPTFDCSTTLPTTSPDLLTAINSEHNLIHWLYDRFRHTDDSNPQQLTDLTYNLVKALSMHLFCEEYTLYARDVGVLRRAGWDNGGVVADEMIKEHLVLKGGLYRLQDLTPNDDGFREYVHWLYGRYKRHADKEEQDVS